MKRQTHPYDHEKSDVTGAATTALATVADAAGEKLDEVRRNITENTEEMQEEADSFVRARPYQAIAIALGIGALFGFIAGRRSKQD
jgi:ElaB/YqjD/DUF883 family membrane-anchored ribosome-binding protein